MIPSQRLVLRRPIRRAKRPTPIHRLQRPPIRQSRRGILKPTIDDRLWACRLVARAVEELRALCGALEAEVCHRRAVERALLDLRLVGEALAVAAGRVHARGGALGQAVGVACGACGDGDRAAAAAEAA